MADYRPASRRPIAEVFRVSARWATNLCIKLGISADAISYSSIIVAAAAALCFWQAQAWPVLLFIAPLFCYLRLWLNMLDGMVALASNQASPRGEILNDLPDRISDIIIFSGVAASGYARPDLAYLAAIFAVLTAYVGLMGQAVSGKREFGGIMSKPWRMVVLHLGAWATFFAPDRQLVFGPFRPLDWACSLVIAGCIQTMFVRLRRTLSILRARQ